MTLLEKCWVRHAQIRANGMTSRKDSKHRQEKQNEGWVYGQEPALHWPFLAGGGGGCSLAWRHLSSDGQGPNGTRLHLLATWQQVLGSWGYGITVWGHPWIRPLCR